VSTEGQLVARCASTEELFVLYLALLAATATASPAGPVQPQQPLEATAPATPAAGPVDAPMPALRPSERPRAPATIGRAGFITAGELDGKCQDRSLAMVSYCYAYVTGVHDSVRAYETWLNIREFCRPLRVAQSELRQAFVDYMQRNPAAASGEAASVVVVALRQKYTCDAPPASASAPAAAKAP
jgi:hypothetical protein